MNIKHVAVAFGIALLAIWATNRVAFLKSITS